jgi:type I restriction enzyme R subunit
LPHWDVPHAAYFVTTCLEGSIPARGLLDLNNYRAELKRRPRPAGKSEELWAVEQWKRTFVRMEHWLDREPAARHLEDPRLAQVVVNALYHFAGQRYDLLAFVVMPSHYHWVFQPREEWVVQRKDDKRTPREEIMHSVNRYTARECNCLLGKQGAFWQHEPYDHWVRDVDELERIMLYVEANPVQAGLARCPAEWLFSSAHDRQKANLVFGEPLLRR